MCAGAPARDVHRVLRPAAVHNARASATQPQPGAGPLAEFCYAPPREVRGWDAGGAEHIVWFVDEMALSI